MMKNSRSFPPALLHAEPFRILFPLGLLIGTAGVSLWPLFFAHAMSTYPGVIHARLMIEGMMGAFIIGFLGTAGPRLTGTPPLSVGETASLCALQILSAAAHLSGRIVAGDALFLLLLAGFLFRLGARFARRENTPPPSFVLVGWGMANGLVGAALLLFSEATNRGMFAYQLGGLMLNIGFVLFPILGVGAFLFPRFLGGQMPSRGSLAAMRPSWLKRARGPAAAGVAIWISFVVETLGWPRAAALLRAGAAAAWLILGAGLFRKRENPPFLAQCFRVGAVFLLLGLASPIFLPAPRLAWMHMIFIGGFSVIVFTVGTRVVLGHSGNSQFFARRWLPFLVGAAALLIVAMFSRVGAEFNAPARNEHLVYAALAWIAATALWLGALLPKLFTADEEE